MKRKYENAFPEEFSHDSSTFSNTNSTSRRAPRRQPAAAPGSSDPIQILENRIDWLEHQIESFELRLRHLRQ